MPDGEGLGDPEDEGETEAVGDPLADASGADDVLDATMNQAIPPTNTSAASPAATARATERTKDAGDAGACFPGTGYSLKPRRRAARCR